jgi:hypothetical protein
MMTIGFMSALFLRFLCGPRATIAPDRFTLYLPLGKDQDNTQKFCDASPQ